jgi:hypothetical protein
MSVRLLSKPFFSVASMLLVVALTLGMSRNSQAAVATYTIDGGTSTLSGQFFDGLDLIPFTNATFKFYGTADTSNILFSQGESAYFTFLNLTFEINDGGKITVGPFTQPWSVYSQQLSGGDAVIGFTNFSAGLQIESGSLPSSPGIFNNLASNGKWFGDFALPNLLNDPFQTDFGGVVFIGSSINSQGAFFEISGAGGGAGGEVPEPTSMAIFGLGALGMAYRARRKSKA